MSPAIFFDEPGVLRRPGSSKKSNPDKSYPPLYVKALGRGAVILRLDFFWSFHKLDILEFVHSECAKRCVSSRSKVSRKNNSIFSNPKIDEVMGSSYSIVRFHTG
jgi:hypothetical protein